MDHLTRHHHGRADLNALYSRFRALAAAINPGSKDDARGMAPRIVAGWFEVLIGLYDEPHRHYHTMDHIANLLERLDAFREGQSSANWPLQRLEVETAIWFHDAIYALGAEPGHNETRSCRLADGFLLSLGGSMTSDFGMAVERAISATVHDGRRLTGSFQDKPQLAAMLMVDLDLAGFADPWEKFEENNRRIRAEYPNVPVSRYAAGRIKFLSSLVARSSIFHLLTELEEPARVNIARHVRELANGMT